VARPFVTYEDDPLVAFRRAARQPGLYAGPRRVAAPSKKRVPTRRNWDGHRRITPKRIIVAAAVFLVVGGAYFFWHRSGAIHVEGLDDGVSLGRKAVDHHEIRVTVNGARDAPELTVNDTSIGEPTRDGSAYLWHLPNLADGTYRVKVRAGRFLFGTSTRSMRFTVDSSLPTVSVPAVAPAAAVDRPFTLDGTVNEKATVTADGAHVEMKDNSFHLQFPYPPAAPVMVKAVDAAGNASAATVVVPLTRPMTRGVHVTAVAWTNPELHAGVQALIDSKQINTVELDLKDEAGEVGFDSKSVIGNEIGAVKNRYPLAKAVADLHAQGIRVVGRVVAFRDPILAKAMWDRGQRDWVVQDSSGNPLGAYGGFANFANADVQHYNLDIAEEGARAGVDEILWDYVRRPEGPIDSMTFPGIQSSVDNVTGSVVEFLTKGQALLRPLRTLQGASVFGIAATRPGQVGQDVGAIALHTDYVAPMLYPSHWNNGEYGVANPTRQPYDIVKASLADFQAAVAPTGRPLVPWLEDFSDKGVTYGDEQVQDQIRAAQELGVDNWLLWNPDTLYTQTALTPIG
jgi:hypothetical protein